MEKPSFEVKNFINQTPSCLKVIDNQGRLLNMNDKGLSLIEAENIDSVFLADVYEIVHPEYRKEFISFNEKICNGGSGSLIFKIVGLKGTVRWMETYASPIKLEDGSTGHIAITNDITAVQKVRSLNEKILELKEHYLEHISSPEKFFDYLLKNLIEMTESEYGFIGEVKKDNEGLFLKTYAITDISWNKEIKAFYDENAPKGLEFRNLKTLFGEVLISEEPLLTNSPKNHPKSFGIPKGHPPLNSFFGFPIKHSGKMIGMFGLGNRPGGFQEDILAELSPYFEAIAGIIANYQLILQNKEKEEKLSITSQRLEFALEASKLGIWEWDLTDNSVQFDQRWGEILGIPFDELKMELSTWESRVHPDDLEACNRDIKAYLNGETPRYVNIHRMQHIDGHWVYILDQGKVSARDKEGNPIRFTGTHLDITKQKEQENEIALARNKAVLAERSKSQFLANMSHEIRTPMNGILGMVDLLNDTKLSVEQKEMIDSIQSSGSSLMSLLNDILDISKIDSGKMELEQKAFSLTKLIKETTDILKPQANEKGIHLNYELCKNSDCYLIGDTVRLKQVLLNLISNSIKFTKVGEVILKSIFDPSQDLLTLTVNDTGIGIPKEKQNQLFEEFVQADSSITRNYGGTGLGLSICKKIIDLMEGEISLESKEGKGTTFKVLIPLSQSNEKPLSVNKANLVLPSGKRILVVEDNSTNLIIIKRILEKLGQEVLTAYNGKEGVDLFKEHHKKIDLILMDMQMPVLDGISATKEIRNLSFGKDIPVIALTANAFDSDRDNCLSAGMSDFLTKPIQRRVLIEVLTKFLV